MWSNSACWNCNSLAAGALFIEHSIRILYLRSIGRSSTRTRSMMPRAAAAKRARDAAAATDADEQKRKLKRAKSEKGRVDHIRAQFDRLVEQMGGVVVVTNGKRWRREAAIDSTASELNVTKSEILFATLSYIKELMQELEDVKTVKVLIL